MRRTGGPPSSRPASVQCRCRTCRRVTSVRENRHGAGRRSASGSYGKRAGSGAALRCAIAFRMAAARRRDSFGVMRRGALSLAPGGRPRRRGAVSGVSIERKRSAVEEPAQQPQQPRERGDDEERASQLGKRGMSSHGVRRLQQWPEARRGRLQRRQAWREQQTRQNTDSAYARKRRCRNRQR